MRYKIRTVGFLTVVVFAIWSEHAVFAFVKARRPSGSPNQRTIPRSRTNITADTNPAYKKSIPGSTNTIQGSRPRTYVKPKKLSYQQHMQTLSKHPFKNQSSSFGYRAGDKQVSPPRVLTSSRPSSRINVQQRVGRSAPSVANRQPMSQSDFGYMEKLAQTLKSKDPELSSRLGQIIAGQKQNRPLTKPEYDLMMSTAQSIDDGDVSYRLHSIAEKRREQMY